MDVFLSRSIYQSSINHLGVESRVDEDEQKIESH